MAQSHIPILGWRNGSKFFVRKYYHFSPISLSHAVGRDRPCDIFLLCDPILIIHEKIEGVWCGLRSLIRDNMIFLSYNFHQIKIKT
jgi:hypothetical protein